MAVALERQRVIGVVEPVRHWALSVEPAADIYIPYAAVAAWPLGLLDIGIRHDGPSGPVASELPATLRKLAPDLPIDRIVTMEHRISGSVATQRLYATPGHVRAARVPPRAARAAGDPGLAAALLAVTALLACSLPARKAAKVEPVAMLRSE